MNFSRFVVAALLALCAALWFAAHNQGDSGFGSRLRSAAEISAPAVGSPSGADNDPTPSRRKAPGKPPEFVPNQLLVRFRDGVAHSEIDALVGRVGASVIRDFPRSTGLKLLRLPDDLPVARARYLFSRSPVVDIAEPNFIYHLSVEPNDPSFALQWGLHNTGQTLGAPDVDINAPEAWDVTTGDTGVVIGILDGGVDYQHVDLADNIRVNPAEIPDNEIDDDGNGWIDDVYGINAAREDSNPALPRNDPSNTLSDHGSHVAGIIAARGNNGVGISGVMWEASLAVCQAFSNSGGQLSAILECMEYFAALKDSGVDIVATNNSWGGGAYSQLLFNAIEEHQQRDILFVAAAGNDSEDVDQLPHYPASYAIDSIISVAAIDDRGQLAVFSNYGATQVDIAAPGVDTYSLYRGNTYGPMSGTSMAAPHVTGVIGLLSAKDPQLTGAELKSHVLATGIDSPDLEGVVLTGRRLSAVIPMVDRDGDGMDDDWEDANGLDRANPNDGTGDPDGDGITNLGEFFAGSNPFAADTDGDGLTDSQEINTYRTDPANADTDGDTLPDFEEVNVYGTDPTLYDTDADGLSDADELNNTATNPLLTDGDGDGIADGWELQYGLDPFSAADAGNDDDGDGLTNLEEFNSGSDPGLADTDGDGLGDAVEAVSTGTDPANPDTDDDQLPDGWEIGFALNPLDALDAASDPDGDSFTNYSEYRVGTDPTDPSSYPPYQDWSSIQGGPGHNGHVKLESDAGTFAELWASEYYSTWRLDMIAADQSQFFFSAYTGDPGQSAAGVRLANGELNWIVGFDGMGHEGPVAIAGGALFTVVDPLASETLLLYSFDIGTGAVNYAVPIAFPYVSKVITPFGDSLYLASGTDMLRVNAATGSIVWQSPLPTSGTFERAVAVNDEYVADFSGMTLAVFDRVTGALVFSDASSGCNSAGLSSTILDGRGGLYIYGWHCLARYDLGSQSLDWQLTNPSEIQSVAVDDRALYILDWYGAHAHDPATGDQLWRWEAPAVGAERGNVASTLNHVFMATEQGTFALDASTGAEVWSHPLGGELALSGGGQLIIIDPRAAFLAVDISGDSDGDGQLDWWEKLFGLDFLNPADAGIDTDADGLTNIEEVAAGTEPTNADGDEDGLIDGDEVTLYLTDPRRSDTDHDGLMDGDEVAAVGTDPAAMDTDGDTYTDGNEINVYLTDPNDALSRPALLGSYDESFEQGLPADWTADPTATYTWYVSAEDASKGNYSLQAEPGMFDVPAVIEFEQDFESGDLVFDARVENSFATTLIRVYVDGIEATRVQNDVWATTRIAIPRGRHIVRFAFEGDPFAGGDTAWLDNVRFEIPRQFGGYPRNILSVRDNYLHDFLPSGALARARLRIPDAVEAGDLAVGPDHRVAIVDAPFMHILRPSSGGFHRTQVRGWSFGGAKGEAAVATEDAFLAIDAYGLQGILRFDFDGNLVGRYHVGIRFGDLAIGPGGFVFAAADDFGAIVRMDPVSLDVLAVIPLELQSTGISSMVAPNGDIYVADFWSGFGPVIMRHDSAGRLLDFANPYDFIDTENANTWWDMDWIEPGYVAAGTFLGDVVLASPDLRSFWYFPLGLDMPNNENSTVAAVRKIGPDSDGDGMPDWWESLHGFDPANPLDASNDYDGDGLNNLAEFVADTEPAIRDTDHDGLLDGDEVHQYGTDPFAADTDADQITDADEVRELRSNPLLADTDADGINDYAELTIHGTDPLRADTDNDGLPDGWEIDNRLDPLVAGDAETDLDKDGLSNLDERQRGTDPNNGDSDFDGLGDGEEISVILTDPLDEDSDDDRMWDGWETEVGLDPLQPTDATADADLDGFDNRNEFFSGSDPNSDRSIPVSEPWFTHQGGSSHTGFVPVRLDPLQFADTWSVDLVPANATWLHPVAANDGSVWAVTRGYFESTTLASLDAATGTANWVQSLGPDIPNGPAAVANGKVYMQSGGGGTFWVFDAETGSLESQLNSFGAQFLYLFAPVPFGGDVYGYSGTYGGIGRFSGADGSQLWRAELPQYDRWAPAVDADGVYVHLGVDPVTNPPTPGRFDVLYPDTGVRKQTIADPNFLLYTLSLDSAPVLSPTSGALLTQGGRLVRFDLNRDSVAWERHSAFGGTPAIANGVVYAVDNGELVAIEELGGTELWRWVGPSFITKDVLATIDHVIVSTRSSTHVIDVVSGAEVWSIAKGGSLSLSRDGMLYIAGEWGDLQAVRTFDDADLDGMPDDWEQRFGLKPFDASDASADLDSDGLVNLAEYRRQTRVAEQDTDADGLTDGAEVLAHGTNPHRGDTDADGLSDLEEITLYSTDATRTDSDADGLGDYDEVRIHSTNPLAADSDGDSFDDVVEVKLGSNPAASASTPTIVTWATESFESGRFPAGWDNGPNATAGWAVVGGDSRDGNFHLLSAPISYHETAAVEWTGRFAAGTIEFDYRTPDLAWPLDALKFFVDGVLQSELEFVAWSPRSYPISAGVHTLRWELHWSWGGRHEDLSARIDSVRFIAEDDDADGMPDGWESAHGLNPADGFDAGGDADMDGLSNLDEFRLGTLPDDADSDGDSMHDGWEIAFGLTVMDSSDAPLDPDHDGYTNAEEFAYGTDPGDSASNPAPRPFRGILELGDINGNGTPDVLVAVPGSTRVHVRDGSTDALISDIDFGDEAVIQMLELPDIDSGGHPEIAMLSQQPTGHVRVQLRDSVTGSLLKNLWFGANYSAIAMHVIDDYSGNGAPEIAVMGSDTTDAIRLQVQDAATGRFLDNVFLGKQGIGKDFVVVSDTSGNSMPELGVLSVLKGNDQVRMQVWDAVDATFQTNVWFGKVYQPQSMITMPDINGNDADEIVAVGVDPATQNVRVQVRDSASAATHYNIWLGNTNQAVDVALINDINGNGVRDLAILLETPTGTGRVRVQDGLNGSFIRNLFYLVVENPTGLAVMPDYSGNGFDELAALGESDGVRHVQVLDTATGLQVNRIDYP